MYKYIEKCLFCSQKTGQSLQSKKRSSQTHTTDQEIESQPQEEETKPQVERYIQR